MDYSIVIPVYRSQATLPDLYKRLTNVMRDLGGEHEIILVDDASPDESWAEMRKLREADPRVKIIQHMKNFGQHKAILCGLEQAGGEVMILMDDDLQNPPEEIPKLVGALRGNDRLDVAMGSYHVKHHSWWKNLASRVLGRLTSHIFAHAPSFQITSFMAIRRPVVEAMLKIRTHSPRVSPMLLSVTRRMANVPVTHCPREQGRSGYSLRRLVGDAMDNILSNSSLPLQAVSVMGFAAAALSFLGGLYVLYRYFFVGIEVAGWTTIVLLLLFFFGLLLFAFGIVGEYLIRILKEVQGTPRSIVRQKEV
jgi:dolichol-phosphate mannosyltransferase/undecaprenyl-phosphate 4-deoxy-4-formamido-L-arabinose transferase